MNCTLSGLQKKKFCLEVFHMSEGQNVNVLLPYNGKKRTFGSTLAVSKSFTSILSKFQTFLIPILKLF